MTFKNVSSLKKFLSWAAEQNKFESIDIDGVKVVFKDPPTPQVGDLLPTPESDEDYKDMLFYSGSRV